MQRNGYKMQVQKINLNNIGRSKGFASDEAYKSLLTNLQFCGSEVQIVTMTSCMPNEGKSTISLELSKGLARLVRKFYLLMPICVILSSSISIQMQEELRD